MRRRPEERREMREVVREGVECISKAFAMYMEEITILPVGYEDMSRYRWLIRDGGRYTVIVYPFLLGKVIEECRDLLSEMQAFAFGAPPTMVTVRPEIITGLTPIPYLTLPTYYDPNDPILIETTRKFVHTYLIPRWKKEKVRGKPLVLKDIGERGDNYRIIFGVIYTPIDWNIRRKLIDIFMSTGREYAISLLSAVTGGRVEEARIRRLLREERVVMVERREEAIAEAEELRRKFERRRRVIEECVIPSLPFEWWVDVFLRYYEYLTTATNLPKEAVREREKIIREKLLEGGRRLYSAWQQWKEYASTDVRLVQSINIILDRLKSVEDFEELLERIKSAMGVSGEIKHIDRPDQDPQEASEYCVHALRTILSSDDHMDVFIQYGFRYPWEEEKWGEKYR
ncbi:hypothetical protein DRN52_05435 [Thermococci archaeon]|nr:MAG: hypothetical protein DRN52_05435 [Thermococci archaeon]